MQLSEIKEKFYFTKTLACWYQHRCFHLITMNLDINQHLYKRFKSLTKHFLQPVSPLPLVAGNHGTTNIVHISKHGYIHQWCNMIYHKLNWSNYILNQICSWWCIRNCFTGNYNISFCSGKNAWQNGKLYSGDAQHVFHRVYHSNFDLKLLTTPN